MPREIPEVMIDVLIAEAAGEGDDGLAQVAQVMFNRADARGQSLEEVVTAPSQFEGYKSPGREIAKAMKNEVLRARVRKIAEMVDYGQYEVPYPDADHFHTPKVSPKWSRDKSGKINREGKLGNHIFYSTPASKKVAAARVPTANTRNVASAYAAPTPPPRSESAALRGLEETFGTSPAASRSPFSAAGRENYDEARSAKLSYNNDDAKRNLTVKQKLENDIIDAVTDVYGPDYSVSVISGRQQKGVSNGTVGSRRHNHAAADVHVYDQNGKRVKDDKLVPLAQHWLASGKGSVGFPAKPGQSMHIDHFGGDHDNGIALRGKEGKLWYYGAPSDSQRRALTAARDKRVGPKVMAKDAPTPPEGADTARQRAYLSEHSNLNTPEESEQAASILARSPVRRAKVTGSRNNQTAAPVNSSQGNPSVMDQFRKPKKKVSEGRPEVMQQFSKAPEVEGPLFGGDSVPQNARGAGRGRKMAEMEDPSFNQITADDLSSNAEVAKPTAPTTVEPQAAQPNLLDRAVGVVQDRTDEIKRNAQRRVDELGAFFSDPVTQSKLQGAKALGTFLDHGQKMGENVRTKLKPLADFLEGPDYNAAEQTVEDGWFNDGIGSNVVAVGPTGTRRVNVSRSDSDRDRDREHHGHMDMNAYRANKAEFQKRGLRMTKSNSRKVMEDGGTLYVPKDREDEYERRTRKRR